MPQTPATIPPPREVARELVATRRLTRVLERQLKVSLAAYGNGPAAEADDAPNAATRQAVADVR